MLRVALAVLLLAVAPAAVTAQEPPSAPPAAGAPAYSCPMKCEGAKAYPAAGKCPVCHMALKESAGGAGADEFTFVPLSGRVEGGQSATFTATLAGDPMLEPHQGAKLNLYVVSRDLAFFAHIPCTEPQSGGFTLERAFPAGEYTVFASFKAAGKAAKVLSTSLSVAGKSANSKAMGVDADKPKDIDGLRITLEGGGGVRAGGESTLTYHVMANGKPADLDPFLGASGRLVAISPDLKQLVHGEVLNPASRGPDVAFKTRLPEKGLYRVWLEVRRGERVTTVPFVIEAQ